MDVQTLADRLIPVVAGLPAIQLVYLFGSRVTGPIGPASDFDFAILLARQADRLAIQARFAHEMVVLLGTSQVDVVVLNRAPIDLAYAVIAQGILLYESDIATRVEYEAMVLSRYGDYLPILRAQRRELLQESDHADRVQRYRKAFERTERTLGEITAVSGKRS